MSIENAAQWCRKLGSPMYGTILESAASDAEAGGFVGRLLSDYADDPFETALSLRL